MKILILDVDSCYFCPCSSAEVGWFGNITRSVCQVKGEENTVYMDGANVGDITTNLSGKLSVNAELEAAGIEEGDTVRMYGLQFDYYK